MKGGKICQISTMGGDRTGRPDCFIETLAIKTKKGEDEKGKSCNLPNSKFKRSMGGGKIPVRDGAKNLNIKHALQGGKKER